LETNLDIVAAQKALGEMAEKVEQEQVISGLHRQANEVIELAAQASEEQIKKLQIMSVANPDRPNDYHAVEITTPSGPDQKSIYVCAANPDVLKDNSTMHIQVERHNLKTNQEDMEIFVNTSKRGPETYSTSYTKDPKNLSHFQYDASFFLQETPDLLRSVDPNMIKAEKPDMERAGKYLKEAKYYLTGE